jgi:anti-sigma regulatory factor (Ser/Thr protein kinase)
MSCLRRNIRSASADLETLSAFVEENALRAGLDEAQVKRIMLVLEEATNNIMKHAYGGQGGELELCCTPAPGGLEIRLVDEGSPFNPL